MPENTKQNRKPNGQFQKGKSGNPGGRPKMDERRMEVVELAREYTTSAMQTLVDIANNSGEPASSRVAACREILDRGWGKAPQSIDLSGDSALEVVVRIHDAPETGP